MGYTPPRRIYVLDFEGTELDGMEVRTRSAPVGMMLEIGSMADHYNDVPDPQQVEKMGKDAQLNLVKRAMETLRGLVNMYERVLVSWNYEDENGEPVPATAEGLLTLDPAHVMLIIRAWQKAVAAVPPASSPTSSGGALSEVPPLPMVASSPSLAS